MSFVRACSLDDLDVGTARLVEIDDVPVCLVRVGPDVVKAVHNTCSHEDYPLHEGWVSDNEIECALHGSTFDLDSGSPKCLPAVQPIPTFAAKLDAEAVWVDVDQQLNDAPVPDHS